MPLGKGSMRVVDFPASDFEKLTVSNTAGGKALTAAKVHKAALITVEGANIRYTIDGTAPTTDTGHIVFDGGSLYITDPASCLALRMFREAAVDATIQVTHY